MIIVKNRQIGHEDGSISILVHILNKGESKICIAAHKVSYP